MRFLAFLLACLPAFAAGPLPALHARADGVTVSGLSSGGSMAVQMHVALSASVSGAGVLAGAPYYCAQGSLWTALSNCMSPGAWTPVPGAAVLRGVGERAEKAKQIDPLKNLAGSPVWLFSGTADRTVAPVVVQELRRFYELAGARVTLVADRPVGHGMPTDKAGAACGATEPPYLNACGFDAAGELLKFLLGPLHAPSGSPAGTLRVFDQQPFGLSDAGFVYVPAACEKESCRMHVAFHGCRQAGERFAREAGYNRWAESNRLIVLYPQVNASWWPFNPRGCWDWWGYSGANYATREGAQLRAVKAMISRLAEAGS